MHNHPSSIPQPETVVVKSQLVATRDLNTTQGLLGRLHVDCESPCDGVCRRRHRAHPNSPLMQDERQDKGVPTNTSTTAPVLTPPRSIIVLPVAERTTTADGLSSKCEAIISDPHQPGVPAERLCQVDGGRFSESHISRAIALHGSHASGISDTLLAKIRGLEHLGSY